MPQITTYTGWDSHSAYGAKGLVFVFDPKTKQDVPLFKAKEASLIDEEWDNNLLNARWCTSVWEVPAGTIIKVFSVATHRGVVCDGGTAYLVVDESQPEGRATGSGYQARAGYAQGPLALIPFSEIEVKLGIKLDPKLKKHYRDGKVTLTPIKEEANGAI